MNMPRTPVSQNIRESGMVWGRRILSDGECDKAQSGKSNDLKPFQLAALAAGKDVAALNGVDVRAFHQAKF
uniref:hypothetical protein n=1 Tax=Escherichia coli TaxID=562 RepID=UPI0020230964